MSSTIEGEICPPVRFTARLLLRPPTATDICALTAIFSCPEVVAHRPDPRPDTPDQSANRLIRDRAHWTLHGFGRWAIVVDARVIGFGGLTIPRGLNHFNLSYHLHPSVWGRGYATELAREALVFAVEELRADRVIGLVRRVNLASAHVLEKAGFAYHREIVLNGAPTRLYAWPPGEQTVDASALDRPPLRD